MRHIALIVIACVCFGILAYGVWAYDPVRVVEDPPPTEDYGTPAPAPPPPLNSIFPDEPSVVLWVIEEDGRRVRYSFRESELR